MSQLSERQQVEQAREFWAKVAKENGWYYEPFYVQVFFGADGKMEDSVSYRDMKADDIVRSPK